MRCFLYEVLLIYGCSMAFYIDQNMIWIARILDCTIYLDFQRFGR